MIDPKWEIEDYLQLADENDFQITQIGDADEFVRELTAELPFYDAPDARVA